MLVDDGWPSHSHDIDSIIDAITDTFNPTNINVYVWYHKSSKEIRGIEQKLISSWGTKFKSRTSSHIYDSSTIYSQIEDYYFDRISIEGLIDHYYAEVTNKEENKTLSNWIKQRDIDNNKFVINNRTYENPFGDKPSNDKIVILSSKILSPILYNDVLKSWFEHIDKTTR